MKDPVIYVALSQSQIFELLAHINIGVNQPPPLREARNILRRVVRETQANNDPSHKVKSA